MADTHRQTAQADVADGCATPPGCDINRVVGNGFQHTSGRVIALGRLMLAALFLLSISVDLSQPAQAPAATYALLVSYVGFAAAIVALTWSNWWLDAKLAGPAHAIDIVLFTMLVLLTEGYTSPFFTFFMFLLLSAAIRWGWQVTALTAILLTLLYLITGLLMVNSDAVFALQRFLVRTAQLVILSLILIWFGINQWGARFAARADDLLTTPSLDQSPLETGLRAAMASARAAAGSFVWLEKGKVSALAIRDGEISIVDLTEAAFVGALGTAPFMYDFPRERALRRDEERNLRALNPADAIGSDVASALGLREGIAIPVRSDSGEGVLLLDEVANLSTDHIDLGDQIAADVAAYLQRHALLKAADESAEARSRLTLARDLHDNVVQFLAAAAFRLEAMKRSHLAGRAIDPELGELKQLMLQEQGELRAFITALRSGPLVAFNDVAADLKALVDRLSRHWNVECDFSAPPADIMLPARLHLDAQQLVREAVANAVRHAGAKSVSIALTVAPDAMGLVLINDGARYPRTGESLDMPQSLLERVEESGGTIEISRGMAITKVSISLPIGGRNQ